MDAKVYAMIDDMSRPALVTLTGTVNSEGSTDYLRSFIRQQYDTGQMDESDIVSAWEDDSPLMCETCGESEQEVHLADAGLCGDCFAVAFREHVKGFFWCEPCGHPHFDSKGQMVAVCLRPCGEEHDHSTLRVED